MCWRAIQKLLIHSLAYHSHQHRHKHLESSSYAVLLVVLYSSCRFAVKDVTSPLSMGQFIILNTNNLISWPSLSLQFHLYHFMHSIRSGETNNRAKWRCKQCANLLQHETTSRCTAWKQLNKCLSYLIFKWNGFVCSFQIHQHCCMFHWTHEELVAAITTTKN